MSTGLTWVMIIDGDTATPELSTSPVQFSDYSEASDFANWLVRLYYVAFSYDYQNIRVALYTTSPSANGQWYVNGAGDATFANFD